MNNLGESVNIFGDDIIVKFLKKEHDSILVQNVKNSFAQLKNEKEKLREKS